MTKRTKNIIIGSIFLLIIVLFAYRQNEKEISLRTNRELTIGKLTRIKTTSGARKIYEFKYLVNKKWIKGQDPHNANWPIFYRKGKAQIGEYYPVEFDKTDIEYSKILITKKPLTDKQVEKYLN
jgi:hypothetical protein